MIEDIERSGNLFYIKVSGKITKDDVEGVIPMIENMIRECKKIKLLVYLNEAKGYTVGGFLADFGFYFKHQRAFNYMAIVGSNKNEKLITELFDKFFPCKARYFDTAKLTQAKEWINQV